MSSPRQSPIELRRDCAAVAIPSGQPLGLRQGTTVIVVQSLGGSYTVQTDRGVLARVDGDDGDALGLGAPGPVGATATAAGPFDLEHVIEQLRSVYDPEIPINVVDLGLVYECDARPLADGGHRVEIKMSMTAPGCGMGDVLRDEARAKVLSVPGVREVDVELVWEPPWDLSRLSDAARLELGLL